MYDPGPVLFNNPIVTCSPHYSLVDWTHRSSQTIPVVLFFLWYADIWAMYDPGPVLFNNLILTCSPHYSLVDWTHRSSQTKLVVLYSFDRLQSGPYMTLDLSYSIIQHYHVAAAGMNLHPVSKTTHRVKLNSYSNAKPFFHHFLASTVLFFDLQIETAHEKMKLGMLESDEKNAYVISMNSAQIINRYSKCYSK